MKNKILSLICGILIGLLLGFPLYASAGNISYTPLEKMFDTGWGEVETTLVITEEGIYRVFIFQGFKKGGITAVKIK